MLPGEVIGERILFGCLDWGSGHVARSISIIRQLQSQGNIIFIWCSGKQKKLFEFYISDAEYVIGFEDDFRFRGGGNFTSELLRNIFRQFSVMRKEKKQVRDLVLSKQISLIISDHRYALYSGEIPSVFITHQVKLPLKSGRAAQMIHKRLIGKFQQIWIPDGMSIRLSGELGASTDKSSYIGIQSRFENSENISSGIVAIISGPEPYSKQFYDEIVRISMSDPQKWIIIAPQNLWRSDTGLKHIADWREADIAIGNSELIVSRPGYSTLMDLIKLEKKAVLIPTSGQYEQEYLSEIHRKNSYGWKFTGSFGELEALIADLSDSKGISVLTVKTFKGKSAESSGNIDYFI